MKNKLKISDKVNAFGRKRSGKITGLSKTKDPYVLGRTKDKSGKVTSVTVNLGSYPKVSKKTEKQMWAYLEKFLSGKTIVANENIGEEKSIDALKRQSSTAGVALMFLLCSAYNKNKLGKITEDTEMFQFIKDNYSDTISQMKLSQNVWFKSMGPELEKFLRGEKIKTVSQLFKEYKNQK